MKESKGHQETKEKAKPKPELLLQVPEQVDLGIPLLVSGKTPPPAVLRKQMPRLQRLIGNRAVLRQVIQRVPGDTAAPNPTPVIMPWTAGALTGIQLVRLRAETLLFQAFGERIKTISADAKMNVVQADNDSLKTEYAKMAYEKKKPDDAATLDDYVKKKDTVYPGTLYGFAYKSQNTVYVQKNDTEDNQVITLVHEMLHMNAAGDWQSTVMTDIDEGTTELLTKKACANLKGTKQAYGAQMGIVDKLISVVGEGTLVEAYFNGAVVLVNALDTTIGPGTFQKLLNRITDPGVFGTFEEKIGKLLDPKAATWLKQKIEEMQGLLGGWVSDEDIEKIRAIRSTIEQSDMTAVREALYPLINSLWSDRQKSMMIQIMS